MRTLKRNLQMFEYYPNLGTEEIIEDGLHTGRYTINWGDPVIYYGNIAVSMRYDYADKRWYGVEETYQHDVVLDDPTADINEDGKIVWNGDDYEIKEVAPSLNVLRLIIRKLPKSNVAGDA